MATTDLASILASWATVVEASPLSLTPTVAAFTHDQQPGGMVANSYYFDDGGNVNRASMTNDKEVRVDRITLWIAKPLNFAGATTLQVLHTLLDDIYRYLLVQARTDGYNVEADTRRITRPATGEVLIASMSFTADYDFNAATS